MMMIIIIIIITIIIILVITILAHSVTLLQKWYPVCKNFAAEFLRRLPGK